MGKHLSLKKKIDFTLIKSLKFDHSIGLDYTVLFILCAILCLQPFSVRVNSLSSKNGTTS